MNLSLSFDDVLIKPAFSHVESRKHVDTNTTICGETFRNAIISSNMDTVTGSDMAKAMLLNGSQACLHRFCSIDENVLMFNESVQMEHFKPWVSIGLGDNELERANALREAGADVFVIDVANGANIYVVDQVRRLRSIVGLYPQIVVGNFANAQGINDFVSYLGLAKVDAFKVGIGMGSMCTTRVVTGCGEPTFSSLVDCVSTGHNIIMDGGIKNSGDYAKALACGAKAVMIGKLLAQCLESPQDVKFDINTNKYYKKYRGSASLESYEVQGKLATHRTPEGESTVVPYTGTVEQFLNGMQAGLRSAMSYVGAKDLNEFKERAEFIQVTNNGLVEGKAYGKL